MSAHLGPDDLERAARGETFEHLSACLECQTSVRNAKARQALLRGLTPYTLSDLGFRRVEAHVFARLETPAPWSIARLWPWALALGCGVLVAVVLWPHAPLPPQTAPAAARVVEAPRGTALALTVLQAGPGAQARAGEGAAWAPVTEGQVLANAATLRAERALLATAEEGVAVGIAGTLTVGEGLSLGAGDLTLETKGTVRLQVGSRALMATEASLSVSRVAGESLLSLMRGSVELFSPNGTPRLLAAPVQVRWSDAAPEPIVGGVPAVPALQVPARPWAWLELGGLAGQGPLVLDGQALPSTVDVWCVTAGRHRLSVGGDERTFELKSGTRLPVAVSFAAAEAPLAPEFAENAREELARQTPKLRACYEAWLKATPSAGGEVLLSLAVQPDGRVGVVGVSGAPVPASVAFCLKQTLQRLTFSPPKRAQNLEVPLSLRPVGRH